METGNKLFQEVNEGYTMLEAINEAKRCLHCKVPQCKKGCPISHDIPDWIHELSMGNLGNAMDIINNKSNLPAVCGRVCPHEKQCEGHCVLNKKGQGIHVGKLERFIADFDGNMGLIRENLLPKTRGKIAVIGSGPAGLTIAGDLARQGFNVEIFEMEPEPGGVLMFGIPEYRFAITPNTSRAPVNIGFRVPGWSTPSFEIGILPNTLPGFLISILSLNIRISIGLF